MIRMYEIENMHPTVDETTEFIKTAHKGQVDKAGVEYWKHPVAVMNNLISPTEDEMHAALLHDVVEDTSYTIDDLRDMGYNGNILAMVSLLTRDKSMTYLDWIRTIANSGNTGAIKVKMADNMHNLDASRQKPLNADHMTGLNMRYKKSLQILSNAL